MSYGTLVINECALPIRCVWFRDGNLLVEAATVVATRTVLPHGAEFRIHGEDGSLVMTGVFQNGGTDVVADPGADPAEGPARLTITQPIRIEGRLRSSEPSS